MATTTIAITGASGTVGPALLRRLSRSREVDRVLVLGRRPPDPSHAGPKVEFRQVDVRDRAAVARGIEGADVVIHMAYALYGVTPGEADLFETNVEGTLNVARAAAVAGARRFVHLSSAVVYGFRPDNPQPIDENAPIRASARHFYSRHKAQAELLVNDVLDGTGTEAYMLRPCAVVGPHAAGATVSSLRPSVRAGIRRTLAALGHAGLLPPLPAPPVPLQFVHEDDVAQAAVRAALGRGPAGVYNLAGRGAVEGRDALRLLGLRPLPLPQPVGRAALRALARVPPLVPAIAWQEAGAAPLMLDTSRARHDLGWRPRWSSRAALESTRAAVGW
jgi:nucleoside-diphosphate-sugar epimerase